VTTVNLSELSRTIISQEITDHRADVRNRLDFGKIRVGVSDLNNNVSENISSPFVVNNDNDKKDLEQRDVSLESITTNNGTILNSYLSSSTKPTRQSRGENLVPNDDLTTDPGDKVASESLLDNWMPNGASQVDTGPEKQLIAPLDHLCFNKTDEEKLTVSGLLWDDQKPRVAIIDNHGNSESEMSSIPGHDDDGGHSSGEGKQIQVGDKNSPPSDDHNHESAGSFIDLKGGLTFSKENEFVEPGVERRIDIFKGE